MPLCLPALSLLCRSHADDRQKTSPEFPVRAPAMIAIDATAARKQFLAT